MVATSATEPFGPWCRAHLALQLGAPGPIQRQRFHGQPFGPLLARPAKEDLCAPEHNRGSRAQALPPRGTAAGTPGGAGRAASRRGTGSSRQTEASAREAGRSVQLRAFPAGSEYQEDHAAPQQDAPREPQTKARLLARWQRAVSLPLARLPQGETRGRRPNCLPPIASRFPLQWLMAMGWG